ncbi:MAG: hypothetical protein AAGD07_14310 [Planctomycetota bacterium]
MTDSSLASVASENHDHDHGHDENGHDDHDHEEDGHEGHAHGDQDHDANDQPDSFGDALKAIDSMGGKITDAFANGAPDDAHHELHAIGHLIERLPMLAKKADLPSEQQSMVQNAAEALMDAFGELDGTLHGGDEVDVDQISKAISTQMDQLQGLQ